MGMVGAGDVQPLMEEVDVRVTGRLQLHGGMYLSVMQELNARPC